MTERPDNTVQDQGDSPTQPLGWAEFIVTGVHKEYFDARPYDGSAAYGSTQPVAKSPEQRESLNGGVSYGATNDIIRTAPLPVTVSNDDAEEDAVSCQHVQTPGGLPAGRTKHQVLSVIDDAGKVDFDWVRAFDDS